MLELTKTILSNYGVVKYDKDYNSISKVYPMSAPILDGYIYYPYIPMVI
jgi:hypothetical protein